LGLKDGAVEMSQEGENMRTRKKMPMHPGGILKRQYMEPLSLTVSGIADTLGVSRKTLSKIILHSSFG
jgi:plasmid maintenance system antidote protein VapI